MRNDTCRLIARTILSTVCLTLILTLYGCGVFNPGKPQWILPSKPGEHHWLVNDAKLTGGSSSAQRDKFDHTMFRSVNVIFVPKNEKNHYVSKTIWRDPSGFEYRTIRQTHDLAQEIRQGEERQPGGTTRIHSMETKELYDREPGRWKVALLLDDELAREFEFSIR